MSTPVPEAGCGSPVTSRAGVDLPHPSPGSWPREGRPSQFRSLWAVLSVDSGFRLAKQTEGPRGAAPAKSRLPGADGPFHRDHQHPDGLPMR